jgi:hypothetical protein
MKLPILIAAFVVVSTTIYAQEPRITSGNPRTETYAYYKGGDSVRFVILGRNDTLQITDFYRNGKIEEDTWKKDSCFQYSVLGKLRYKSFGWNKSKDIPNDSTLNFFANGQLSTKTTFKNNVNVIVDYSQEGKLWSTAIIRHASSVKYRIDRDYQNVLTRASRTDTLSGGEKPNFITYDTLYFDNGRLFKTRISGSEDKELGTQYYKEDGTLAETILPDSLELIEFKDNVDCYYGLKNRQGDTIIKPRFDNIQSQNEQMWGGYSGKSLFLFDRKGAPITLFPPNLTGLNYAWELEAQSYWTLNGKKTKSLPIFDFFLRGGRYAYTDSRHFLISQGDKHGIVDGKGTMLLAPQSRMLTGCYLFGGQFFHFEESERYILLKSGFLDTNGKPLFSTDDYETVIYSNYQDYFFLCERPFQVSAGCSGLQSSNSDRVYSYPSEKLKNNTFGLGKSDGTVVLERKYSNIYHLNTSPLFVTSLFRKVKGQTIATNHDGIYDSRSNRWLVDSVGFQIINDDKISANFLVVKQLSKQKMGIMDTSGRYVLPIEYDSIGIVSNYYGLFWVKKAGKYQVFEIKDGKPKLHKAAYDFLSPIEFNQYQINIQEDVHYFFAQQKSKWGVIDLNEKTLLPFDYDYVSRINQSNQGFLMVKNNQADYFELQSIPNPMPDFPHARLGEYSSNKTSEYTLANNINRIFIINETGKVIVPPQYRVIKNGYNSGYILIEDDYKHKKVVFLQTGQQYDYPFDYKIDWANPACDLMIVHDSTEVSYGVVSTDGKLVMPCKNYGIAIGDNASATFFVKQDTPVFKREYYKNGSRNNSTSISSDSLNIEDNNWLMYNKKGILLSEKPFRFPIDYYDSVGIGMKENAFNLYKLDGSILTPFVKNTEGSSPLKIDKAQLIQGFNNILRVDNSDYYALFYNQGLTPTLILTTSTGEILVNSGRYDGISKFYGNYALVTAAGKMGLIDTLGKEVIAPQDLRIYSGNLIDSLNVENKIKYKKWLAKGEKGDCDCHDLPIQSVDNYETEHPDSLGITNAQRSVLWNLLLDKTRKSSIITAGDLAIERVASRASASFFYWDARNKQDIDYEHYKINVEANTMSFILDKKGYSEDNRRHFYSFYRRNNRWEDLQINDLLNIQGEKRWLMNDLITKKVKALKDQQIDCSNASAFITTVENRFMLTKEGVNFYFNSTSGGETFVVISFTWAELSPFLKMKL